MGRRSMLRNFTHHKRITPGKLNHRISFCFKLSNSKLKKTWKTSKPKACFCTVHFIPKNNFLRSKSHMIWIWQCKWMIFLNVDARMKFAYKSYKMINESDLFIYCLVFAFFVSLCFQTNNNSMIFDQFNIRTILLSIANSLQIRNENESFSLMKLD